MKYSDSVLTSQFCLFVQSQIMQLFVCSANIRSHKYSIILDKENGLIARLKESDRLDLRQTKLISPSNFITSCPWYDSASGALSDLLVQVGLCPQQNAMFSPASFQEALRHYDCHHSLELKDGFTAIQHVQLQDACTIAAILDTCSPSMLISRFNVVSLVGKHFFNMELLYENLHTSWSLTHGATYDSMSLMTEEATFNCSASKLYIVDNCTVLQILLSWRNNLRFPNRVLIVFLDPLPSEAVTSDIDFSTCDLTFEASNHMMMDDWSKSGITDSSTSQWSLSPLALPLAHARSGKTLQLHVVEVFRQRWASYLEDRCDNFHILVSCRELPFDLDNIIRDVVSSALQVHMRCFHMQVILEEDFAFTRLQVLSTEAWHTSDLRWTGIYSGDLSCEALHMDKLEKHKERLSTARLIKLNMAACTPDPAAVISVKISPNIWSVDPILTEVLLDMNKQVQRCYEVVIIPMTAPYNFVPTNGTVVIICMCPCSHPRRILDTKHAFQMTTIRKESMTRMKEMDVLRKTNDELREVVFQVQQDTRKVAVQLNEMILRQGGADKENVPPNVKRTHQRER